MNKLSYGKKCIGQVVYNKLGESATITNMETVNGHKCVVDLLFENGQTSRREKFHVARGAFSVPGAMTKKKLLSLGFKPVVGYESRYMVNKKGEVYGIYGHGKGKKRVQQSHNSGENNNKTKYSVISLYNGGKSTRKLYFVHRIVVEAFIRKLEEGEQVDHINGDKSDNRLCNLQIVSREDNNKKYLKIFDLIDQDRMKRIGNYCMCHNINFNQFIERSMKSYIDSIDSYLLDKCIDNLRSKGVVIDETE